MNVIPSSSVTTTDLTVSLEDKSSEGEILSLNPLIAKIKSRFDKAQRRRRIDEERWLKAYYNYRGQYGKEVKFTSTEKSRVFIKLTKTKVLAAYGQVIDVVFNGGKIPLSIEPMELPGGVSDSVHVDLDDAKSQSPDGEYSDGSDDAHPAAAAGYEGDGNDLKPGETLMDRIGAFLSSKLKGAKVKEGPSIKPNSVQFDPAAVIAKRFEKKIHDQLTESKAEIHIRYAVMEMVLLGTGMLKGPLNQDKEYPKWDQLTGEYTPDIQTVPKLEAVSIWNIYPDPEARSMADCDYIIQRHSLTKSALRQLKRRPFFRASAIDAALEMGPNYRREWWEHDLDDHGVSEISERFEVLEYWGTLDADLCEDWGIDIPKELENEEEFQVNCWICGDEILRLVLNPFTPRRIPYFACPYELNPYNFFGVGCAENMEDSQTLCNGFARLAVDNAVLSGNMLIEIDETNLVPGQNLDPYPGKVYYRQGGVPGQAIFSTSWKNTSNENLMMFDRFRQLADESTGIPSYSHGQTGVQGTGRTAAGMSMLMGASTISIKTVVRNLDDYVLRVLGEAMYAWNMQFDFDPELVGEHEIKARGVSSLMQKEVKSQRLVQFMQAASNPMIAPLVKWPTVIRELADSMDIDPDKIVNNPQEAQLMALLMAQAGGGAVPGAPGGPGNDQNGGGGGNIGVGAPPMPGDPQFSGNGGGGAPPPPPSGSPMGLQ